MVRNGFHDKAFDEGTILKLDILTKYLEAWVPVFINHPSITTINIFDFQCGPGEDVNKVKGSPLRIYDVVAAARPAAKGVMKNIHLHFNDRDETKIELLKERLKCKSDICKATFSALDFMECLDMCFASMKKRSTANFLFIDPTGLVGMTHTVEKLSALFYTDFLLFVPVQYIARLYKTSAFQKYLPGLSCSGSVEKTPKELCAYIDSKLREQNASYFLAHFSIKKKDSPNVHGLIFGTKHPLGLDKFLQVTWGISPNGVANFEMSGDLVYEAAKSGQCLLLGIGECSRREEVFCAELKRMILSGELKTTRDIALFCYRQTFLPTKSARSVLQELRREGKIVKVPALECRKVFGSKVNEFVELK